MSIQKDKKRGTYIVAVSAKDPKTGKFKVIRRRGFTTKKEAQLEESKITLAVKNGSFFAETTNSLTYQAVYEKWLKTYRLNCEPSTLLKTERMFRNHFLPKFGEQLVDSITSEQLYDYAVELAQKFTRSDTMFNYCTAPLSFAHKMDLMKKDIVSKIEKPKSRRNRRSKADDFYDEWQLNLFLQISENLSETNYKQYAFFMMLSQTGMRKQEICALTWDDLDFENESLTIDKVVTRGENGLYIANRTKNVSSTRRISVDSDTLVVMENWRELQRDQFKNWDSSFLIFCADRRNENGQKILSMNTVRKWLLTVQDLMDLEYGSKLKRIDVHGFRHTHISLLAQTQTKFQAIAARVGHANIKITTDIYTHVTKESEDELKDSIVKLQKRRRDAKMKD